MRSCHYLTVCWASLCIGGCGPGQPQWSEFSPPEGDYRVLMPGTPTREAKTAEGVPVQVYSVKSSGGTYTVACFRAPPGTYFEVAPETAIVRARDNAVKHVNGTLNEDKEISLGRHPGRAFEVQAQGTKLVLRVYFANNNLYTLEVAGKGLDASSPNVQKFFDSFQLSADVRTAAADKPSTATPSPQDSVSAAAAGTSEPVVPPGPGIGPSPPGSKPVTEETPLSLGDRVLALDTTDQWLPAEVLELLPRGRVKVNYVGWSSDWDEAVPRSRLRLPAPEDRVPSALPDSDAGSSRPRTDPSYSGPHPVPSSDRPVTAATPLTAGDVVQVESAGQWYPSDVLEILPDGQVKIHFRGWSSTFDEVVPRSRVQLPPDGILKRRASKN